MPPMFPCCFGARLVTPCACLCKGPRLPLKSVEKKLRKLMLNMTSRRSGLTAPERGRRKNTVLRAAPVETITSLVRQSRHH